MKVKIKVDDKILERKAYVKTLCNFCQLFVRYQGRYYFIENGDEYLRGLPEYFELDNKTRIYK